MASGRTHDTVNLVAFPPIVYYLKPVDFLGFTAGYLFGTFFLSPDNDLYHSLPSKRWKILRFIWKPYSLFFSHRGVSHLPIIGSMLRLFYLVVVFSLFYLLIYLFSVKFFPESKNYFKSITFDISILESPFFVSFLVGLFLSEIIHIITDMVYSFFKRINLKRIF